MARGGASHRLARMELSKSLPPDPTDLIDWMNGEGVLDLDWDFPVDGNLAEAGLDSKATSRLVTAVEDQFGFELGSLDLTKSNIGTPKALAALIASKLD